MSDRPTSETRPVALACEEAIERLEIAEDYDAGNGPGRCVHTFREAPVGMLGAHWYLADVEAAIKEHGAEESGPQAQAANHGVVVIDDRGPVFFETKLPTPVTNQNGG